MRPLLLFLFTCFLTSVIPSPAAQAHFGMVIPSQTVVMDNKNATLQLSLKFWHPFENTGMDMEQPASFQVFHDGAITDLLPALKETKEQGKRTWKGEYTVAKPGLHTFVMEPQPYFEKDEDSFIVHLTKVYVSAFGDDDGWDEALGLRAEIIPLTRPNALYAGNVFQGQVMQGEEPVPDATVEVEWYPGEKVKGTAPHSGMITQTVKTDASGVFTYAPPASGWWGFAALLHDDNTIQHEGKEKPVELGTVVWVYFHPMLPAQPLQQ